MLDLGQTQSVPLRNQPQRELNKIKDAKSNYKEMRENKLQQALTEQCEGGVEKDGKNHYFYAARTSDEGQPGKREQVTPVFQKARLGEPQSKYVHLPSTTGWSNSTTFHLSL